MVIDIEPADRMNWWVVGCSLQ